MEKGMWGKGCGVEDDRGCCERKVGLQGDGTREGYW
jgi:hypothetical protein